MREQVKAWLMTKKSWAEAEYAHIKAESQERLRDPEWLWSGLLLSMATYGNSKGAERLKQLTEDSRSRLRFENLQMLESTDRQLILENEFRMINPRYLRRKVECLDSAITRVLDSGGLSAVQNAAKLQPDAASKISFMQRFKGIGPKYARNIWMDLGDSDVVNSIAIDSRINKLIFALGLQDFSYGSQETELLKLGAECGLNGWCLDRILYDGLSGGGELERVLLAAKTSAH